jgi:ABC-type transport system involved in multi-copper enzyme maturation permease subunit
MNRIRWAKLTTVAWLVRDTFRQSIAHGIFAALLLVSLMSIALCLTISVSGPSTLWQGDESPDFLSRNDAEAGDAARLKTSGVTVADGKLTLGFGAISVPWARDTAGAVHFLELVLAGGVADTLGLLLTLIWTAGFLPSFLEGRNISVLLAKPAPRWVLLLGKYAGVLCFVLFHALVFVGGTWLAIGWRTGFWDPTYLVAIPLLLLQFSIFFGFSVLLAVWTHNAVVCVFGSIVFWCVAWSMNFGRHALMTASDMVSTSVRSSYLSGLIDFGYWVLPKPADLSLLLSRALGAGNDFASLVDAGSLEAHGFSMLLSVLTSAAFGVVMLVASARMFQATDY